MKNFSDNNAKKLFDSPIFAGSLGSKELFHSNIWAFLIEHNPKYLGAFFQNNGYNENDKIIEVYREKYHMDLLIETNNSVFIIENKIKSLPNKIQLKQYGQKIGEIKEYDSKEKHFLLTGISDDEPSFLEEFNKERKEEGKQEWKYLSYKAISEEIHKVNDESEIKDFTQNFTQEYAEIIKAVSELLNAGIEATEGTFYFPEYAEEDPIIAQINKLRLGDIFQKMNAELFVRKIKEDTSLGKKFICKSGFTHQSSIAEFFFEKKQEQLTDNNKTFREYVRIGVQIQNTQFRWYIETNTKDRKKPDEVFSFGKNQAWFDKNPVLKQKKGKKSGESDKSEIYIPIPGEPMKSSMTEEKCKYQTTTNTFVYQYFNIERNMCGFDCLASMVVKFMKEAEKYIDSLENKFLKK